MESPMTIVLLTHDRVLSELLKAELSAMGLPAPDVAASENEIPEGAAALFIDFDEFPFALSGTFSSFTVGISRREHLLSEEIRTACDVILHRPFAISTLRSALEPIHSHYGKPRPISGRHRITARRSLPKKKTEKSDTRGLIPLEAENAILCNGNRIPLTPGETAVFLALCRANGAPVSREALAEILGADRGSNLPDVHICAIRKKLSPYGKDVYVHTVRGKGYLLLHTENRT